MNTRHGMSLLCIAVTMFVFSTQAHQCHQTADVIFVVDTSSSIWPPYFNINIKDFIKNVIANFKVGPGPQDARIGLIQFSTRVYREFYLNQYDSIDQIENHIDTRMRYRGGNTNTHKAIDYVNKRMMIPSRGSRDNVSTIVIIITDGESGYPEKTRIATDFLKRKNADVFAIGVGSRVRQKELEYMASKPAENFVFKVKGFAAINEIENRIANRTCLALAAATTTTTTSTTTTTTPTTTPTTTTTTTPTTTTTTTPTTTTTTTTPTTTTTTPITFTTTSTTTTPTTTTTTTPSTTTTTPTTTTPTTTTTTPTTTTTTPSTTTTSTTTTTTPSTTTATTPTTTPTTTTTTTPTTTTTTSTTTTASPTTTTTTTTTAPTTTTSTSTTTTLTTTTTTPATSSSRTTKYPPKPSIQTVKPKTDERPQGDQASTLDSCRGKPADIYFLLDASTSVWIGHFRDRVLPFVRNLVSSFHISPLDTRVGLVTYSDNVEHVFDLTKHKNVKALLKSLQPENVAYLTGGTNTGDAIDFVTKRGLQSGSSRKNVAKIVITVTDGLSQKPWKTAEAAKAARNQGITMFAVGVGKNVDLKELKNIASDPDDQYVFTVDSFLELSSITRLLAQRTCQTVAKQPNDEPSKHGIDCSSKPLNVMFVHEYMNSVTNFKLVLDHVLSRFATQAAIYAPHTRIGVMSQPCIGDEVSMIKADAFQKVVSSIRDGYHVTLADLVRDVRTTIFKSGSYLSERKVAVLVIDETIDNSGAFRKEVRRLKYQDVHVIVLAIGDINDKLIESVASFPVEDHVIRVDSYKHLEHSDIDLLDFVCSNHNPIFEKGPTAEQLKMGPIIFNGMPQ